jgi:predicted permease
VGSAKIDRSFAAVPATAALVVLACTGLVLLFYSFLPWFRDVPRPVLGVLVLSAAYGNVTYLGLPVITEMLGPERSHIAVLYDLLASTPILLTLGVFLSARYGSGKAVSLASSLGRVAKLPPLWGVLLGIAVRLADVAVPQVLLDTTMLMGRAVIPIMIFTIGLALDFHDLRRLPVALPALAIKLFVAPALAWWIGSRLGLSGPDLQATVIEGAMPVMVLSLVIADEFGLDVPLSAAAIAASTVLLFFTLPFMLSLLA